ncbi:hypothetical protein L2E82_48177 [Cichorium intybus]|uniref:Uncharacterized protein n=1 Tax=Cichorium intybus TaxID=13427 RepID=A0ACB8YWT5_CICIN|nr:hypothetical protein L2E82_48177 [Cichorium intybus]
MMAGNITYNVVALEHRQLGSTVGYCDPVYAETGVLTKESDVYSLGVVLFEANKESLVLPRTVDSSHLKAICLPHLMDAKVVRLVYTHSGLGLLALDSSGVHKLWKWQRSERNPSGKSTASIAPELWQPSYGALMSNDINDSKPAEESAACIALSKNDSYLISASGGKVSLFNMMTFKVMTTFMAAPPAATYLAFHPQDNNIIAIGMEDSTIQVYNVRIDEVKITLRGHQKHITGLAFSKTSLVSSGADAQASVGWCTPTCVSGITKVGRRRNQEAYSRHLVILPLWLEKPKFNSIMINVISWLSMKWSPRESLAGGISSARYSCDGLLIFTGFLDGAVGVFDGDTLSLQRRIAPSDYLSATISSNNSSVYPVVIAAHPAYPNQFALGTNDGYIHVIEIPYQSQKSDRGKVGIDIW